jgi:hypothetical protein
MVVVYVRQMRTVHDGQHHQALGFDMFRGQEQRCSTTSGRKRCGVSCLCVHLRQLDWRRPYEIDFRCSEIQKAAAGNDGR